MERRGGVAWTFVAPAALHAPTRDNLLFLVTVSRHCSLPGWSATASSQSMVQTGGGMEKLGAVAHQSPECGLDEHFSNHSITRAEIVKFKLQNKLITMYCRYFAVFLILQMANAAPISPSETAPKAPAGRPDPCHNPLMNCRDVVVTPRNRWVN
ncbi:hypothetical protein PSTT_00354 [Puccinia striiformis]|uniref:Uncharacterized protein n=1 Tax=Puccinia striiformis TaxID=27350 RepID=A0A2S4W7B6_9BASI|nr:hypothetical protein PSTT_00354 [Puccinia striiformis]